MILYGSERINKLLDFIERLFKRANFIELSTYDFKEISDITFKHIKKNIEIVGKDIPVSDLRLPSDDYYRMRGVLNSVSDILKNYDLSEWFPIYNEDDEEVFYNWHDALDLINFIKDIMSLIPDT